MSLPPVLKSSCAGGFELFEKRRFWLSPRRLLFNQIRPVHKAVRIREREISDRLDRFIPHTAKCAQYGVRLSAMKKDIAEMNIFNLHSGGNRSVAQCGRNAGAGETDFSSGVAISDDDRFRDGLVPLQRKKVFPFGVVPGSATRSVRGEQPARPRFPLRCAGIRRQFLLPASESTRMRTSDRKGVVPP